MFIVNNILILTIVTGIILDLLLLSFSVTTIISSFSFSSSPFKIPLKVVPGYSSARFKQILEGQGSLSFASHPLSLVRDGNGTFKLNIP